MTYVAGWQHDEIENWSAAACFIRGGSIDPIHEVVTPMHTDFIEAAKGLRAAGHAPGHTFGMGMLHVHGIGWAIFDAVGRRMPHHMVMNPEQVKDIARQANWGRTSAIYTDSDRECAKAFLEVCVKHNLGIAFGE